MNMKAVHYLKNRLPTFLREPIRQAFHRVRGVSTSGITHQEIAALIAKPTPTILEIGCNDGSDTLELLRAMPRSRIYCFEPDSRPVARFKQQLRKQINLNQVSLSEVAISDRNGSIDFHVSSGGDLPGHGGDLPGGWDQSGSIRPPKTCVVETPWLKFETVIKVSTRRLDDWRAENGVDDVDFIWMDVQGAEGDVIAGGTETLKNTRFLYTEYSNRETYEGQLPLKALMAKMPWFEVVRKYPGDVLLKNRLLG
jgi:FkbM family methyltransferase